MPSSLAILRMPGRGFRPSALRFASSVLGSILGRPSRFPYRRESLDDDRFFVWLDVSATEFCRETGKGGPRRRKETAAKRRRRRAR